MFIDFYKDYSWNMLSGFITERSYCLSIASGDKTLTEHIYKVVNLGNCIKNNDKNYDNGLFSMPFTINEQFSRANNYVWATWL